jgi:hypothetical protein
MYLPSLQELSFNFCEKLEYFPHVMQRMDKPLKIHMINTAVKEFPKSIGNLTGLQYIDMSHCKGVKDLSSRFLLLPKLLTLKIDGCSQLGASFQRFKDQHSGENGNPNLETLHFSEANLSYEDVDAIIECFPKLVDLKVSHSEFAALPKCIRGSLHLKSIDVSFCNNLTEIPELPLSIQKIDARHCPSLTSEASSLLWSKVYFFLHYLHNTRYRQSVVVFSCKYTNVFCFGITGSTRGPKNTSCHADAENGDSRMV